MSHIAIVHTDAKSKKMKTPDLVSSAGQRLQTFAYLSEQGQVSEIFELTLDKLWSYETEDCRRELDELQVELSAFEKQYGYSSAEFYQRFQAGQTDDRMDFVEWASFCQMADLQQKRLRALIGEVME